MPAVEVVPYDPRWARWFETEATAVRKALGDNCLAIHHIGSTAVPGLAAKPILDMIPVVGDLKVIDPAPLQALGYEDRGDFGILTRHYFHRDDCHIHIFEEGNPEIQRHVDFRDHMRSHMGDRQAYAELKMQLAQQHPHDREAYCLGKEEFVADIERKIGKPTMRVVEARSPREHAYVRRHLEPGVGAREVVLIYGGEIVGCARVGKSIEVVMEERHKELDAPFKLIAAMRDTPS